MKHNANPDDFDSSEELKNLHRQWRETARYRRDMRIVNGIMVLCAVALVVLLAIQTLR